MENQAVVSTKPVEVQLVVRVPEVGKDSPTQLHVSVEVARRVWGQLGAALENITEDKARP